MKNFKKILIKWSNFSHSILCNSANFSKFENWFSNATCISVGLYINIVYSCVCNHTSSINSNSKWLLKLFRWFAGTHFKYLKFTPRWFQVVQNQLHALMSKMSPKLIQGLEIKSNSKPCSHIHSNLSKT